MNTSSLVIVGASNLVYNKKPLVACNCETSECHRKDEHLTNIPPDASFTIIARPGAKFGHKNQDKCAENLFKKALALSPRTIVFYMDILMNSVTSPPWQPNSPVLTPEKVLRKLFTLERKANAKDCNFVLVLCRRKRSDRQKLPPSTSRHPGEQPREIYDIDNEMNSLLKQNFFSYVDLKLSNASFKVNDEAHQTQVSKNLSLGRIIRYFTRTNDD